MPNLTDFSAYIAILIRRIRDSKYNRIKQSEYLAIVQCGNERTICSYVAAQKAAQGQTCYTFAVFGFL